MKDWNICLPGPSLDWKKVDTSLTTISVNIAIAQATRTDFWLFRDDPNPTLRYGAEWAAVLKPIIIHDADCRHEAHKKNRKSKRIAWQDFLTSYEIPCRIMSYPWDFAQWWIDAAGDSPAYSATVAIGFCAFHKVNNIYLHGCDMKGDNYYCSDLKQERPSWDRETKLIRSINKACEARGIKIWGLPSHVV
jgi:hypothetical protein